MHDLCVVRLARGSLEEREQAASFQVTARLGRVSATEKPAESGFTPSGPWYGADEA